MKEAAQRSTNRTHSDGDFGPRSFSKTAPSRYFVAKGGQIHVVEYYPARIILRGAAAPMRAVFVRKDDFQLLYEYETVSTLMTDLGAIAEVLPLDRRLSLKTVELINRQHETGHGVICFILRTGGKGAVGYEGPAVSPGEMDFLEPPIGYETTNFEDVEFVRCPLPSNLPRCTAPSWRDIRICIF